MQESPRGAVRPPVADQIPAPPPPPSGAPDSKTVRLQVLRLAVDMAEATAGNWAPAEMERLVKRYAGQLLPFVITGYWADGTRPNFPRINREDNDR